jgi:hypothetical protein
MFFLVNSYVFSPFHALNRKILNKSSGVAEVNYCNTLPVFRYFLSPLFCYFFHNLLSSE